MIDFNYGIKLMPLENGDIGLVREWRNNPAIWRWCRQNDLVSDKMQARWFDAQDSDPTMHMYMITTNEGHKCGVCGLTSHDRNHRRAEFSIYIAPSRHNQGLGKKALKTLISHGFHNLNLHSIWGETFDGNHAAKMFEGLGMALSGILKDSYFKGGKYINSYLYSILESEWKI